MTRPRILSSRLTAKTRRVYRAVLVYFAVVFLAMIWPVVTLFSHARPLIFGLPFFLSYLTVLLMASFFVLLGLFLWEGKTDTSADPAEDRS